MKKCPHCGQEYPDDATACIIDTTELVEHPPKPKPAKPPPEPWRPWPDYQWRAKDAWKCIGILICFQIILAIPEHLVHSAFPIFYRSGLGSICNYVLFFAIWTITACYFARTETLATCYKAFGLDRKPTYFIWFGLVMTLIIRFATHLMYLHHWGRGSYSHDVIAFRNTVGFQKIFFLILPIILAPIFEEVVNRGFLYKAFRASYPVAVSMLIMVVWTLWTHFDYWQHSWIAVLNYCAWTILQCYLREKSPSIWDCIICHAVSNAVLFIF